MSWEKEIEELRRREALANKMGGPEKVKRQHDGRQSALAHSPSMVRGRRDRG